MRLFSNSLRCRKVLFIFALYFMFFYLQSEVVEKGGVVNYLMNSVISMSLSATALFLYLMKTYKSQRFCNGSQENLNLIQTFFTLTVQKFLFIFYPLSDAMQKYLEWKLTSISSCRKYRGGGPERETPQA